MAHRLAGHDAEWAAIFAVINNSINRRSGANGAIGDQHLGANHLLLPNAAVRGNAIDNRWRAFDFKPVWSKMFNLDVCRGP